MSKHKQQVRKNFRDAVFNRDQNECRTCGRFDVRLDAHHITDRNEMPNGGYVLVNGITLCTQCHSFAEVYHKTQGSQWATGMHPNDLYELIGSSKELAIKASENLLT